MSFVGTKPENIIYLFYKLFLMACHLIRYFMLFWVNRWNNIRSAFGLKNKLRSTSLVTENICKYSNEVFFSLFEKLSKERDKNVNTANFLIFAGKSVIFVKKIINRTS